MCFLLQMGEIDTLMHEMKSILYGNAESVPAAEACSQLTQEFFKNDTLRLIINCLPKLNLEVYIYSRILQNLGYICSNISSFFYAIRLLVCPFFL